MTASHSTDLGLIENRTQLIDYLAAGCKPKSQWRLGTEHEKFTYNLTTHQPIPYEGENGIGTLLQQLVNRYGWQPVIEDGITIALSKDKAAISLEPGGQFELSGAPLETVHQTAAETAQHFKEVEAIGKDLGLGFLPIGFHPQWTREQMPWMPKARYQIMRDYMPKKGSLGLDMMLRTCTIQVNLDFSSEADMVQKFRASLALQPIVTALFANSSIKEGKDTGFKSYRSHIWTDTDNDRCGILPFVFEDGMGFERYVDYMLDVPMYFVYRNGQYINAAGQSFRDFMAGKLPAYPNEMPALSDWTDHLSTAFPEVRLKKFLEMRGADGGTQPFINALPALWAGILYDQTALDAATDLVKNWTQADHVYLREYAPKQGFDAVVAGQSVREWARQLLQIATVGLKARGYLNESGADETIYLQPLWERVG
jgi:glutamate--cysteine ligase